MNIYTVYVCGIKPYCNGVPVEHVDAKSAAEEIAFKVTGIQRVEYLGTVPSKRGLCKQDIHVYQDEKGWIYNVHRNGESYIHEDHENSDFTWRQKLCACRLLPHPSGQGYWIAPADWNPYELHEDMVMKDEALLPIVTDDIPDDYRVRGPYDKSNQRSWFRCVKIGREYERQDSPIKD